MGVRDAYPSRAWPLVIHGYPVLLFRQVGNKTHGAGSRPWPKKNTKRER